MRIDNLTITKINEVESGTSKAGKEWKKLVFVGTTDEQYNNLYAFQLFGAEKVDNFNKFNKEGNLVNVEFNVDCREWEGKYFTSLSAWRVEKATATAPEQTEEETKDDFPF